MGCDSLYGAYLKAYHPYEFYATMLKLYTDKGKLEKIASIINEMNRYKGITLTSGRYGQDNRDWYIDKNKHTISQSLGSIKFVPLDAADTLYKISQTEEYSVGNCTFTDLLHYIVRQTSINKRTIEILIGLNYFESFGNVQKLLNVFKEYTEGANKVSKTIKTQKTIDKKLEAIKAIENTECENASMRYRIALENEMLGTPLTRDETSPGNLFFVQKIDDKYGIKIKVYRIMNGATGTVKMTKANYERFEIMEGDLIAVDKNGLQKKPRYSYKDGKRKVIDGEFDVWLESFSQAS